MILIAIVMLILFSQAPLVMKTLPKAKIIDSRAGLERLVSRLHGEAQIAVDTESNSLHAYRGRTCLIQLSTRGEDWLIDPLALDDISALGAILAAPEIEKVFHAAEFDLICLKRDFDFTVRPVFDTMAAARVCGYGRIGLGNMLEDLFGIRHPKKHQTANWGKRPLSASQLRYAQMDTHYLLRLRDALYAELKRAGRLDEAREYFADVTDFAVKSQDFNPDGFGFVPSAFAETAASRHPARALHPARRTGAVAGSAAAAANGQQGAA